MKPVGDVEGPLVLPGVRDATLLEQEALDVAAKPPRERRTLVKIKISIYKTIQCFENIYLPGCFGSTTADNSGSLNHTRQYNVLRKHIFLVALEAQLRTTQDADNRSSYPPP